MYYDSHQATTINAPLSEHAWQRNENSVTEHGQNLSKRYRSIESTQAPRSEPSKVETLVQTLHPIALAYEKVL
jgi:hypothetical protein